MDEAVVERNIAAARRVCEAWAFMERDEFQQLFAPDSDYRNIPIDGDRHIGPDAAHDILCRFKNKWNIDLEVHNVVGDETKVMAERTEHFVHKAGSKPSFDLPVMGVFEFKDGKITAWRDYFDLKQAQF
ncbi:MAG: limonene-1,2-epoxide hydrolase family protein [Acidimicrobiales bacterium]